MEQSTAVTTNSTCPFGCPKVLSSDLARAFGHIREQHKSDRDQKSTVLNEYLARHGATRCRKCGLGPFATAGGHKSCPGNNSIPHARSTRDDNNPTPDRSHPTTRAASTANCEHAASNPAAPTTSSSSPLGPISPPPTAAEPAPATRPVPHSPNDADRPTDTPAPPRTACTPPPIMTPPDQWADFIDSTTIDPRLQPARGPIARELNTQNNRRFNDKIIGVLQALSDDCAKSLNADQHLIDLLDVPKLFLRLVNKKAARQHTIWRRLIGDQTSDDHTAANASAATSPPPRKTTDQASRNASTASKLLAVGEISRATAALFRAEHRATTDLDVDRLRSLHPKRPLPNFGPAPDTAPLLALDPSDVARVARSLPRKSAAGPSGWSFELIRASITGDNGPDVLKLWTLLINNYANGHLRLTARGMEALRAARLIGVPKPDGGTRPIAVGECITRFIHRAIATTVAQQIGHKLLPQQYAIGITAGCETIIHAVNALFARHPDGSLLETDIRNAYNEISRHAIVEQVDRLAPVLSRIARHTLGTRGLLWINSPPARDHLPSVIAATTGVPQGDPLSSIFFALGFHSVATAIRPSAGQATHTFAFADDLKVFDRTSRQQSNLDCIASACRRIDLTLVPKKLAIYQPLLSDTTTTPVLCGDRSPVATRHDGIDILGSAIGDTAFIRARLLATHSKMTGQISTVCNATISQQEKLIIIRRSLWTKSNLTARTIDPDISTPTLQAMTSELQAAVQSTLGITPSEWHTITDVDKLLASMPTSKGGLGLPELDTVAPYAFVGALIQAQRTLLAARRPDALPFGSDTNNPAWRQWHSLASRHTLVAAYGQTRIESPVQWASQLDTDHAQKQLYKHHVRDTLDRAHSARAHCDATNLARLNSICHRRSALWIDALPTSDDYRMSDRDIRNAYRLRLGLSTPHTLTPTYTCTDCKATVSAGHAHAVACRDRHGLLTQRHNQLIRVFRKTLVTNNRPTQLEPRIPDANGTPTARGDVAWVSDDDKTTLVDVSVIHPNAATYRAHAACPLGAATFREEEKRRAYAPLLRDSSTVDFHPMVFETYGAPGPATDQLLGKLASEIHHSDTGQANVLLNTMWRALSVALQKGNSKLIEFARGRQLLFNAPQPATLSSYPINNNIQYQPTTSTRSSPSPTPTPLPPPTAAACTESEADAEVNAFLQQIVDDHAHHPASTPTIPAHASQTVALRRSPRNHPSSPTDTTT